MVSTKRREDSTKRQQTKRLLDVGTENELKRKENDKNRKKGEKNPSYNKRKFVFAYTRLRDILNKPPPRYRISLIQLSLVYIGGNKFVDTNGEFIEVLYTGEKTLKNCINNNIKLFDPVCFRESLQYKKNPINNENFDYFYIELNSGCGLLYFLAKPETILYAEGLVKEKDLNKSESLINSFQSFTSRLDLDMCSNWKKPRANQSSLLVHRAYEKLTGINTIVPTLID